MGSSISKCRKRHQADEALTQNGISKVSGDGTGDKTGSGQEGQVNNAYRDTAQTSAPPVEMNDIEVQTEEIEEPGPNPAEEDLIRLQSSMCEIQEDFTRERQMLKDQIAHLQAQVLAAEKVSEEAGQNHHKDGEETAAQEHLSPKEPQIGEKAEQTSDIGLISVPEKPLPVPPAPPRAAENTPDATVQKNEIIINETERLSITNPAFEPDVDSSSSSSSEPPPKPERNVPAVEPWAPAEPIKSTIISSTSESDQEITPQKTDEAEAPKEVPDEPAQEQVTQESDEETQAPPPKPVPDYPDEKTDEPEATQSEEVKPFEDDFANFTVLRKSSTAEPEKDPFGFTEDFAATKNDNTFAMDEFVPVIDRSKPATVEKVDWGISSSEDEAGESKSANTVEDPFKDDPFSAQNDELNIEEVAVEKKSETKTSADDQSGRDDQPETGENKAASDSQIHQMLEFFNKKYEENTGSQKSPEIPIPKVTNLQLGSEPVESAEQEVDEADEKSEETHEEMKITETPETAAMEKAWESDSTDDEQKTQISTKGAKMLMAKQITLESTDDEVGLTELDTDMENDGGSIIPDASQSTVADHDDRSDFLKTMEQELQEIQKHHSLGARSLGNEPEIPISEQLSTAKWNLSDSDDNNEDEPNAAAVALSDSSSEEDNNEGSPVIKSSTESSGLTGASGFTFSSNFDTTSNAPVKKMAPVAVVSRTSSRSSSCDSFSSS